MKMAKPSERDIDAAGNLMSLLLQLDRGDYPNLDEDADVPDWFDEDNYEHLRAFYDAIKSTIDKAPGFPGRVIGGMCYVIMYDKNEIIDPDSDVIELHPKLAAALKASEESQGAGVVPEGFVLMPKRLTAENGAKGAMSGEFKESLTVTCHECGGSGDDAESDNDAECPECKGDGTIEQDVPVTWDTIKNIYRRAVELLAAAPAPAVAAADQVRELYECIGKGGVYEFVGCSNGAGSKRGETIIVYADTQVPYTLYHRTMDDFHARMRRLPPTNGKASSDGEASHG